MAPTLSWVILFIPWTVRPHIVTSALRKCEMHLRGVSAELCKGGPGERVCLEPEEIHTSACLSWFQSDLNSCEGLVATTHQRSSLSGAG